MMSKYNERGYYRSRIVESLGGHEDADMVGEVKSDLGWTVKLLSPVDGKAVVLEGMRDRSLEGEAVCDGWEGPLVPASCEALGCGSGVIFK